MLRLKELREKKGVSQKEIAEKINKTFQAYSLYEIGKRDPDTSTLIKLARYFNVSVDYLLDCDQDLFTDNESFKITSLEIDHLKKYRTLDERGKQNVNETLEREYKYCNIPNR